MAYRKNNKKCQHGFTLIEVIAVLVIIGIFLAVAATRVTSSIQTQKDVSEAETLKMHIRYAQLMAMGTDSETVGCKGSFGISISGKEYYMFKDCDLNNKATLPNIGADKIVQVSSTITPSCGTFVFDEWGAPYCSTGTGDMGPSVAITVTLGAVPFIIKETTGFIP